MKESILFLLLITLISVPSNSQDSTRHLTLEEAISASVSNNDAMKLSTLDAQISKSKLRQTDALFLPQVNFTYSALVTNNPLQAFGLKLQQGSIKETDFNPTRLNDPPSTRDFSAKVEVQQPLLNLDMHYQRKAVANQVEMHQ